MRLYITCFRDMAHDSNNKLIAAPMTPPIAEIVLDIRHGESIVSEPFPEYTHFICVKALGDCAIAIGPEPVADPDYHIVEANERLWYGVHPGHAIAVTGVDL